MTHTPHDALVHAIFGQAHYAAEELRAVLPRELLAQLELGTLAPIEGSFIDEELRASSADLLFSIGMRGGGSGLIYVLFEHQSTLDERIPLRLLRYQSRIWERHATEHPDETKIPPIVPMLLHHGPKPWPWKPSFSSVVALDERSRAIFGKAVLAFDFVLDDLARQTDAEILSRGTDAIVRLTLLALRNGRSHPRLFELMTDAMRALRHELRGPEVVQALGKLARYALEVGDEPLAVVRAAFESALVPEARSDPMVSTADQMRIEFRREILLEILEARFGTVGAQTRSRVEAAPVELLKVWTRRIVSVQTLEELFAD